MISSGHKIQQKISHDVSSCFIDEHKQADNDDDKVNVNIFNFGIVAQNIMNYLKILVTYACVVVIMRKKKQKKKPEIIIPFDFDTTFCMIVHLP